MAIQFNYPSWHRLHKQYKTTTLTSPSDKSGLPPGSLVHIGEKHSTETNISVIQYNADQLIEKKIDSIDGITALLQAGIKTWINVDGLSDTLIIARLGNAFSIHPLVLEDILSTHQRPKMEEYESYFYMVLKGISATPNSEFTPTYQQVSILLMENCVITFKEKTDDTFNPIYHRLQNAKGKIRQYGADYLTYVLLDTLVDEYFRIEDCLDEIIFPLEDSLLTDPTDKAMRTIQQLRQELIVIKRNVTPLRELLSDIHRSGSALIQERCLVYFADVLDHVLRVNDSLESYRERIANLQDIYLTSISNKMNETMKVLTIFASIFIPLTFIAGIYGMNFEYMPELKWRWAYPSLWLLFISITIALLIFFKKKDWL